MRPWSSLVLSEIAVHRSCTYDSIEPANLTIFAL